MISKFKKSLINDILVYMCSLTPNKIDPIL